MEKVYPTVFNNFFGCGGGSGSSYAIHLLVDILCITLNTYNLIGKVGGWFWGNHTIVNCGKDYFINTGIDWQHT